MKGLEKVHSFGMLDVIRGLAAVVVAQGHLAYYFSGLQMPGHYLAVDGFFMLSGFVLAYAYEPRFAAGLGVEKFFTIRLIRLYPLYLLGFLLGLVNLRLMANMNHTLLPPYTLALAVLFASFFLPLPLPHAPAPHVSPTLYPLDHPTWTLPFELLANVVHAALAPRLTNGILHVLILILGALLIQQTLHFGYLDMGYRATNFLAGIPRTFFSYFLGVRLYRLWLARSQQCACPAWVIIVATVGILCLPVPVAYRVYYDLTAVMLLFPVLIYQAASVTLATWSKRWLVPLGTASYAYYVLHVPFGEFCAAMAERLGWNITRFASPLGGVLVMLGLFGLALALDSNYDLPLRKWLNARLIKRHSTEQ